MTDPSAGCSSCGPTLPQVDAVRDVLDLAAVVLSAGPSDEYHRTVEQLMRTPRESLVTLSTLLLSLSREGALVDVRHMGALHALRDVGTGR